MSKVMIEDFDIEKEVFKALVTYMRKVNNSLVFHENLIKLATNKDTTDILFMYIKVQTVMNMHLSLGVDVDVMNDTMDKSLDKRIDKMIFDIIIKNEKSRMEAA